MDQADQALLASAEPVTGEHVAGPSNPAALDPYFKDAPDILKTYEIDYDTSYRFSNDLAWASLYGMAFVPPCWPVLPLLACGRKLWGEANLRDQVQAQHLAITRDGIRYVVDRHPTGCRLNCQEQGKISKTVPYDKMTDCDIEEPAGSSGPCCCLVPNVLSKINVDTASSGNGINPQTGQLMHELQIVGLRDAEQFKRDVWAMKRGEAVDGVDGTVAPVAVSMIRDATGGKERLHGAPRGVPGGAESEMLPLLREQVALLRDLCAAANKTNELLAATGRDTPP